MASESPAPPRPTNKIDAADQQVVVYQHSNMFYWWPVWLFGFICAAVTYFGDHHMAIVPRGTKAVFNLKVDLHGQGEFIRRDAFVLDENQKLLTHKDSADQQVVTQPTIFVSRHRSIGTMFLFVLLVVMFITNITLRGQWSLVFLIVLSCVAVVFWAAGYWDIIFERLGNLSIFINLGGYMMISLVVFLLWLVNFFVFDRQHYVVFTPGQVRLCMEIGSGEIIYDTFGMTTQKTRSDLFRHMILGFGSGDLILRFPRVDHPIELHNILSISRALERVEKMMQEKAVVVAEATPEQPGSPAAPPKA